MPSFACKKDANHDELSDAARRLGWYVVDTYQFAQYKAGWPDAVWAKLGRVVLVEYKVAAGRLTKAEAAFARDWPSEYRVVRDLDDVIAVTEGK